MTMLGLAEAPGADAAAANQRRNAAAIRARDHAPSMAMATDGAKAHACAEVRYADESP